MKTLRILLVSIALAVSSIASALAQSTVQASPSPETMQAANELTAVVSVSMVADFTAKITTDLWPAVEAALRVQYQNVDASTVAELRDEFVRRELGLLSEAIKGAPVIYARYFTVQEMRDIVVFYRTPTGAKALKVLPQTISDMFAATMPQLQVSLQNANDAFVSILRKHGYAQ
jgi:hypothetical protein